MGRESFTATTANEIPPTLGSVNELLDKIAGGDEVALKELFNLAKKTVSLILDELEAADADILEVNGIRRQMQSWRIDDVHHSTDFATLVGVMSETNNEICALKEQIQTWINTVAQANERFVKAREAGQDIPSNLPTDSGVEVLFGGSTEVVNNEVVVDGAEQKEDMEPWERDVREAFTKALANGQESILLISLREQLEALLSFGRDGAPEAFCYLVDESRADFEKRTAAGERVSVTDLTLLSTLQQILSPYREEEQIESPIIPNEVKEPEVVAGEVEKEAVTPEVEPGGVDRIDIDKEIKAFKGLVGKLWNKDNQALNDFVRDLHAKADELNGAEDLAGAKQIIDDLYADLDYLTSDDSWPDERNTPPYVLTIAKNARKQLRHISDKLNHLEKDRVKTAGAVALGAEMGLVGGEGMGGVDDEANLIPPVEPPDQGEGVVPGTKEGPDVEGQELVTASAEAQQAVKAALKAAAEDGNSAEVAKLEAVAENMEKAKQYEVLRRDFHSKRRAYLASLGEQKKKWGLERVAGWFVTSTKRQAETERLHEEYLKANQAFYQYGMKNGMYAKIEARLLRNAKTEDGTDIPKTQEEMLRVESDFRLRVLDRHVMRAAKGRLKTQEAALPAFVMKARETIRKQTIERIPAGKYRKLAIAAGVGVLLGVGYLTPVRLVGATFGIAAGIASGKYTALKNKKLENIINSLATGQEFNVTNNSVQFDESFLRAAEQKYFAGLLDVKRAKEMSVYATTGAAILGSSIGHATGVDDIGQYFGGGEPTAPLTPAKMAELDAAVEKVNEALNNLDSGQFDGGQTLTPAGEAAPQDVAQPGGGSEAVVPVRAEGMATPEALGAVHEVMRGDTMSDILFNRAKELINQGEITLPPGVDREHLAHYLYQRLPELTSAQGVQPTLDWSEVVKSGNPKEIVAGETVAVDKILKGAFGDNFQVETGRVSGAEVGALQNGGEAAGAVTGGGGEGAEVVMAQGVATGTEAAPAASTHTPEAVPATTAETAGPANLVMVDHREVLSDVGLINYLGKLAADLPANYPLQGKNVLEVLTDTLREQMNNGQIIIDRQPFGVTSLTQDQAIETFILKRFPELYTLLPEDDEWVADRLSIEEGDNPGLTPKEWINIARMSDPTDLEHQATQINLSELYRHLHKLPAN